MTVFRTPKRSGRLSAPSTARTGRRAVLGLLGLLGLLLIAGSLEGAEAASAAILPIQNLNAALTEVMKKGRATPFPERFSILAPVVQEGFDLPAILRLVVGPHWDGFPPDVQKTLLDEFFKFTVASYVANFDGSDQERLEILPTTRKLGNDEVVETRIIFPKGDPVRIDYVMRNKDGRWRVVDVLLDGTISRVAVQRSDFRHIIEAGGPSALIASLRRKVADLSGGTIL